MAPKQKEFNDLIRKACEMLQADEANGVLLAVSPSTFKDEADANFAGNLETGQLFTVFGHVLGKSMAKEPEMGKLIGESMKQGILDHRDGDDGLVDMSSPYHSSNNKVTH